MEVYHGKKLEKIINYMIYSHYKLIIKKINNACNNSTCECLA
jgi:hypothetical protein